MSGFAGIHRIVRRPSSARRSRTASATGLPCGLARRVLNQNQLSRVLNRASIGRVRCARRVRAEVSALTSAIRSGTAQVDAGWIADQPTPVGCRRMREVRQAGRRPVCARSARVVRALGRRLASVCSQPPTIRAHGSPPACRGGVCAVRVRLPVKAAHRSGKRRQGGVVRLCAAFHAPALYPRSGRYTAW
jgi:hypothetical protein